MKKKKVVKRVVKKKKLVKKIKKPIKKKIGKEIIKKKSAILAKKEKRPTPVAPVSKEGVALEEIGVVTHYFPHVEAAVVKLTKGSLSFGDIIIIKGHTTEFKENVESMQLDHVAISNATPGQEIGLKVKSKVREHDVVYKQIK